MENINLEKRYICFGCGKKLNVNEVYPIFPLMFCKECHERKVDELFERED